ncbi:MAG: carboxypeptidase regulatory-like domain-containing protein [Candidatus Cloacimonetes bacterium]|nr:carboxypeptidase regulatory-like domain-containing protein [Candidatus Cloacimonadota bacterium]
MKAILAILTVILSVGMISAANVQGVVTDSDTGETISGATVRFIFTGEVECEPLMNGQGNGHGQGNGGGNGNHVWTVVTDEAGFYSILDIPDGIYRALARKIGYYPAVHVEELILEGEAVINFELTPGDCENPVRMRQGVTNGK